MEARWHELPSGLGEFSTMQKVNLDSPPWVGPFVPRLLWPGDISDTAALEKWLSEIELE
jgi:hypothetical protein